MATDSFNPGDAPNSSGQARKAGDYLKTLRASLDSGAITVSDFVQQGKKAAQYALENYQAIANKSKGDANSVNWVVDQLRSGQGLYGFGLDAQGQINVKLPQEYQLKLRDEMLPKNISDEERQALINQIPSDVDLFSDEGKLIREGIRQSIQLKDVAAKQKTERATGLQDLASFLAKEEDRKFNQLTPELADQASASGLYRGTGYSEALAKERSKLAGDTSALLAAQGLSDRQEDISALASVLGRQQDYATAGLQRKFGLDDSARGYQQSVALADLVKPKEPKTNSLDQFLKYASTGATIYGAFK